MTKFPAEWEPTTVHLKSGWKNNPVVLSEIVTFVNEEIYVDDESAMMEVMDLVLEWMKSKYTIESPSLSIGGEEKTK